MLVEGQTEDNLNVEEENEATETPKKEDDDSNLESEGSHDLDQSQGTNDQEDEAEQSISFGDDEQEDDQSNQTIQEMRKALREANKREREYKKREKEYFESRQEKQELRRKPTLADHDFDEDAFYDDLSKYEREKIKYESKTQEIENQKKQIEDDYNQKLQSFNDGFKSLKFKDKDEALEDVLSKLDNQQQGVILDAVDNPAMIVYALGKNSKKLEDLSQEKNLIRFGSKLAKLETQLKVIDRKPKTKPETKVKSSVGTSDRAREKLLEEARRTRNYKALHAYDRRNKKT